MSQTGRNESPWVPDTPETHHIIGVDEALVSIEGHDVPGHDLPDAQCFDVHDEGSKAGVMPAADRGSWTSSRLGAHGLRAARKACSSQPSTGEL